MDFDRLNSGEVRYCCVATDVETGEGVPFDTAAGDRITIEHLLASGSLLPAFPPVRIADRLLGDGGFSANVPLEPFLASDRVCDAPPLCFVVDLFSAAASAPESLEKAAERATDLKFACQTAMRIEGLRRERALEARLAERDTPSGTDLFWLALRATEEEAGPEKVYDFSAHSLRERRKSGTADALAALARLIADPGAPALRIHRL